MTETAAVPEADLSGAVQALVNAAGNHSGLLVIIGLACGVLIQIGKTRFGGGLMNKVPSAVRLWIPFVLGAVVGFVERVQGGSPWVAALAGALLTGQSAVTLRKIFESHGGEKIMPVVK